MKRLHVHVSVKALDESVRFYSALFNTEPNILKDDYAKWVLDDPYVNFAISIYGRQAGIDHIGMQAENADELKEIKDRLAVADLPAFQHDDARCCYSRSDKYWFEDPQGVAWEAFQTLASMPMFGPDVSKKGGLMSCCMPKRKAACC